MASGGIGASPRSGTAALLAAFLLVVQVLLGAVTVKLVLPPWVVITHFANAMVLLATLLVVGLRGADPGGSVPRSPGQPRHGDHGLVLATAALGFVLILFGAQVANFDAGLLCLGFPLCNGSALPPDGDLARLHWSHRALALGFLVVLGLLVSRLSPVAQPWRRPPCGAGPPSCWARRWPRSRWPRR